MLPSLETKFVFLLGNPLAQSMSASVHNHWYEANGKNLMYFPIEVKNETDFDKILTAVRVLPFAGLGITKPFKVSIMKYLDEVEPVTGAIGSANTVVIENGRWIGYNTDGIGALRALRQNGFDPKGRTIFCYGAGGAARSVCFMLASGGAKSIAITDITDDREKLAREINEHFRGTASCVPAADRARVASLVGNADLVINATGIGMGETEGRSPAEPQAFRRGQLAFDAIYNPRTTQFLADAERSGASTLNGLGMFIGQAAEQIELWTGAEDPTEELVRLVGQLQPRA